MSNLTDDEQRRFARHLILEGFGQDAQQKLIDSSVLMVGAGGLGASCLMYLASAGVGRIGIIDHDHVELSNLQRQPIYEMGDINRLKVEAAADRLSEIAPDCVVDIYPQQLRVENAESIIARYDVVADGCDHFQTRFAVQRACYKTKKPLISAAALGWQGQLSTFTPFDNTSPCYRCLVPELPADADTCSESGVLGPLLGILGSMQASEVIKQIIGQPALVGKWLRFDARSMQTTISDIHKDPFCVVCGNDS